MGLTPLPMLPPPPRSELDIYRDSITPPRSSEHLLFHLIPVFCVVTLIALIVYAIFG